MNHCKVTSGELTIITKVTHLDRKSALKRNTSIIPQLQKASERMIDTDAVKFSTLQTPAILFSAIQRGLLCRSPFRNLSKFQDYERSSV